MPRSLVRALPLAALAFALSSAPASALPTMIRLGYATCDSCHYAPQGGGPLNPYGRAIDEAQSLRAGEYEPRTDPFAKALTLNGRIAQDLRLVMPFQRIAVSHETADGTFRPRLLYRNVTQLPRGFAAHLTVTGETQATPRPARAYDPIAQPSSLFVNVAALRYRPLPGLDITAGRDQLPSGVNIPDLASFVRARNRLGSYDAPLQIKANWAGKRHQITPFVYGPGGNEARGERESGGGALAEFDLLGRQRTVVGMSLQHGSAAAGERQTVGAYARLGFGAWGILAEHDVTDRRRRDVAGAFKQQTSYGQLFWAAREWLVASAIAERLTVEQPFPEKVTAGKFELSARLTSLATVSTTARVQRDALTHRTTTTLGLQVALKTVN